MRLDRPAVTRCARAISGAALAAALIGSGGTGVIAQSPAASPDPAASAAAPFPVDLIAAPGATTLDLTYPEWAGQWFLWALSAPASTSPLLTDACVQGQGGNAWFVPHTLPGNTLVTRCETYGDQFLLIGVGQAWCDTISQPDATDEDLAACVEEQGKAFTARSITIDGQPIAALDDFWVVSPPVDVQLPEDDLLGADALSVHGVGGGWFVMVQPLAPGPHPVVIRDESPATDGSGETLVAESQVEVDVVP